MISKNCVENWFLIFLVPALLSSDHYLSTFDLDEKLDTAKFYRPNIDQNSIRKILLQSKPSTFIITKCSKQELMERIKIKLSPKVQNVKTFSANIAMDLYMKTKINSIERWPLEYKQKVGWRLVTLDRNGHELSRKEPFFPHLYILCLHYAGTKGPLSCTLDLNSCARFFE